MEGTLPLGLVPGLAYPIAEWRLGAGDVLVLITDGVVEAQDSAGDLFGFDRVKELVGGHATAASLALAAREFGQQDDITVLSVESQRGVESELRAIAQPASV
jgi:serine phosphatase RsbU (regulator of sigma subunit)